MSLKLVSWNINGIRAVTKKGFWENIKLLKPDIFSLQEIKAGHDIMVKLHEEYQKQFIEQPSELDLFESKEVLDLPPESVDDNFRYQWFWHACRMKAGYSGVGTMVLTNPNLQVAEKFVNLNIEKFDQEGRLVCTKYKYTNPDNQKSLDFCLINGYFPQGGRGIERINYKIEFYETLFEKVKELKKAGEKILICGDLNTTVADIDLARPAQNRKTTGCLPEEREALNLFLENGFVDSFRHFYPDQKDRYTYWDQITRARNRNVGWRIDYFLVGKDLLPHLKSAQIHDQIMGSDHCPVSIELEV